MGLRVGGTATVLVNANTIMLVTESDDCVYSPRNQFTGTIAELRAGSVSTEVELLIPPASGDHHRREPMPLLSVISNQSVEKLGLSVGKTVTALFHGGNVVLAASRKH